MTPTEKKSKYIEFLERKPIRLKRSRQVKQVSPNGLQVVYVGGGTRWGNPFRVVKYSDGKFGIATNGSTLCNTILIDNFHALYDKIEKANIDAVKFYSLWLSHNKYNIDLSILKGKNLSCWCKVADNNGADYSCHADYLIDLVNDRL